jgi:hypothetical protein
MEHGCFTTLQSQIDSQPSGLNAMNRIQSVERLSTSFQRSAGKVNSSGLDHQQRVLHSVIGAFNDVIKKKRPHMKKKKALFHQDKALSHKSMKTRAKLQELGYELLPHQPDSPDLAFSDFF